MHKIETHEFLKNLQPIGRMGEVDEVVDAVIYLNDAMFVTGEVLHTDGGACRKMVVTDAIRICEDMNEQKSLDTQSVRGRAMAFCQQYGLRIPILEAPMAGSSPVDLAVAVANAGGMGAMGALLSGPDAIAGCRVSIAEQRTFSTESLDSGSSSARA
jgi:hypothetical protein